MKLQRPNDQSKKRTLFPWRFYGCGSFGILRVKYLISNWVLMPFFFFFSSVLFCIIDNILFMNKYGDCTSIHETYGSQSQMNQNLPCIICLNKKILKIKNKKKITTNITLFYMLSSLLWNSIAMTLKCKVEIRQLGKSIYQ